MNIYVGNLSKEVTEDEIKSLFSEYGHIKSVKIIRDMFNQESRGFGFVEMQNLSEGQVAINELNSKDLKGKKLIVSEARAKSDNRKVGNTRTSFGNSRKRW